MNTEFSTDLKYKVADISLADFGRKEIDNLHPKQGWKPICK